MELQSLNCYIKFSVIYKQDCMKDEFKNTLRN